jgi:hypothetical protein
MIPGCQPHPRPCPRGKGAGLWGAKDIGSLESCSLKQQQKFIKTTKIPWGAKDIGSLESCSLKQQKFKTITASDTSVDTSV